MNVRAVRALVRRDLRRALGSKPVLIPALLVSAIVLVVFPAVIGLLPTLGGAVSGVGSLDDLLASLPPSVAASLPDEPSVRLAAFLLVYLLAPLYLLVPLSVATVVAADSFAGERERGTLEVLLTAPATDSELFVAKVLAAFVPALALGVGGGVVYGVVADLATGEALFPNLLWTGLVLWLGPAVAAAGLGAVVLASTKGHRSLGQFFSDVIVTKQLSVRGALGASTAGYVGAADQLESDPRIDDMVSHQFPLDEADRAIQAAGLLGHDELISVAVTF